MGELVLFLAFMVAVLLWAGGKFLYRLFSGESRRQKKQEQRLCEAQSQFEQAILNDRFPSDDVLAILAHCTECFDEHGLRHDRNVIPERLWDRLGYRVTYGEAVERIRKEQERTLSLKEFEELARRFESVVSSCSAPWDELSRTAKAVHGDFSSVPFLQAVKYDLLQMLTSLSVANGTVPERLGRLYQAVFARLEPRVRLTAADCIGTIAQWDHNAVSLPAAINQLRTFDEMKGDRLSQTVAATYSSFLEIAYTCFPTSIAVTTVKNQYASLLTPFVPGSRAGEASSGNRNESKCIAEANGNCPQCSEYYSVLRLNPDANEGEIKTAYRDLAQIYHPDRFNGNERLRQTAEGEMKKVNAAYSHIMGHF
jgi:hypothetical protein